MRGVPLDVGYPADSNNDYDFEPRPIMPRPPLGPITKAEFRDRFYTYCDKCCHRWHQRQMSRWLPGLYDREAIKALPKRKRKIALEMQDSKRELFWGLLVREQRSSAILFTYICLFNLPGYIFFFLWLFQGGHGSDLQNASVPPMVSLSLTMGFVGWLFHSHEGSAR